MLFETSGIEASEREQERLLLSAFDTAKNRKTVSVADRFRLSGGEGWSLLAVNRHARVHWSKHFCAALEEFFCDGRTCDHDRTIYFVTLVDVGCATATSEGVDIDDVRRKLRVGLRGLNHIGIIEPAFYTNLQVGVRFNGKRCIFWHVHALVWGIKKRKLRDRLRAQRKRGRYLAIAQNFKGTDVREIEDGDLPVIVGYMLKSPNSAYRVGRSDLMLADGTPVLSEDGEVEAKFFQRKGKLRPGERISLFHAMKDFYLDALAIAGGEGVPILARAKEAALARWKRQMQH